MNDNEKQLRQILSVLNSENILKDIILIGSWCLLFYKKLFNNFDPLIRTIDIDFYVPNSRTIKDKNGIVNSLRNINYDLVRDTLTNKSTFISPDGFELEFFNQVK